MIKEQRSYGPFGEEIIKDGDGARTSYIVRENDNESNLGFFGVRHYDPTYGRFLSVDPLWKAYVPFSPYAYCRNNPITRTDASGLGDEPTAETPVSDARKDNKVYQPALIAIGDPACNCHSWAHSNCNGDPQDPANYLEEPGSKWDNCGLNNVEGMTELEFDEANQPGDMLLYFNEALPDNVPTGKIENTHSAIVVAVDECGNTTLVMSKWGEGNVYIHHPRDVPDAYGPKEPTGVLQGMPGSLQEGQSFKT